MWMRLLLIYLSMTRRALSCYAGRRPDTVLLSISIIVLCNGTYALEFFDDKLSTLKFADRAQNIPVKPNGNAMGENQKKRMVVDCYRNNEDEE